MTQTDKPTVRLSLKANEKLEHWVDIARGEVSGLGLVDEVYDADGTIIAFEIEDIFLVEQVSSSSNTELDQQAVAEFLVEAEIQGYADRIKLWWHSHGGMDVFWSGTDEACIEEIGGETFLLSLVANKAGEVRARVDIFCPFRVTIDRLPTEVDLPSLDLRGHCEQEFRAKVIEAKPTTIRRAAKYRRPGPEDFLTPEAAYFAGPCAGPGYEIVDESDDPRDDDILYGHHDRFGF